MATASNQFGDKKCYTCQPKTVAAITSCCGCHRHFCCKHFIEHRDQLSKNLNNIVNQHDEILQDLKSKTNHSSKNQLDSNDVQSLFRQIDDWEIETINACHLAANKARDSIKQLLNTAEENDSLIERLSSIAKELEEQRQSVNFVERDLERWMEQLEELKIDVNRSIEFPNNIIIITQAIDWEESIKISQLSISDKMTKHYVLVVGEKGVGKTTFIHYAANFFAHKRFYVDHLLQTTIEPNENEIIVKLDDLQQKFTFNRYSFPIDNQSTVVFLDPLSYIEDGNKDMVFDALSDLCGINHFAAIVFIYDGTELEENPDWQNEICQSETLKDFRESNDASKQFSFVYTNCSSRVLDFYPSTLGASDDINFYLMQNSAYQLFRSHSATDSAETDFNKAMETMKRIIDKIAKRL